MYIIYFNLKIVYPAVLKFKIKNQQITIEHKFIKHSYNYVFHPKKSSIRLVFRTCYRKYTYHVLHCGSTL